MKVKTQEVKKKLLKTLKEKKFKEDEDAKLNELTLNSTYQLEPESDSDDDNASLNSDEEVNLHSQTS